VSRAAGLAAKSSAARGQTSAKLAKTAKVQDCCTRMYCSSARNSEFWYLVSDF
jgi:hypothetical protein